jgi:hypothetical protein
VVKQVHRRVPVSTLVSRDQVQKHTREEISPSPPPPVLPRPILKPTTPSSSPQRQPWSSEEVYQSTIVQESHGTKQADFDRQPQDHFRPARYSPISPPSRVFETVSPPAPPTKAVKEDQVNEEYHVEFETINNQEELSDSTIAARRTSNWRNELREKYSSNSSDTQHDQVRRTASRFFFLLRPFSIISRNSREEKPYSL